MKQFRKDILDGPFTRESQRRRRPSTVIGLDSLLPPPHSPPRLRRRPRRSPPSREQRRRRRTSCRFRRVIAATYIGSYKLQGVHGTPRVHAHGFGEY
ncbi:hypothetical protein GUJ93_ZPchr0006g43937 [Zizania palustris]|uniref:Uncharacterized protein n=1 Tax=Zizania palustris TaxID=103762 RepID=A0A8J5VSQ0_ZIZPA|nr:hypothetical protein GUJ93_ZPchr0006g43937 [Zizania palustris]